MLDESLPMMIQSKFKRLVLAGICTLGLAGCFYSHEVSRSYSTLAEAKEDIEKGWIPDCLPPSTHSISDTHDLDLNLGEGSFEFAPEEFALFQTHPAATNSDLASRHPVSREWPALKKAGYLFLTVPEFIVAVHPSGKVRYWFNLKWPGKT